MPKQTTGVLRNQREKDGSLNPGEVCERGCNRRLGNRKSKWQRLPVGLAPQIRLYMVFPFGVQMETAL